MPRAMFSTTVCLFPSTAEVVVLNSVAVIKSIDRSCALFYRGDDVGFHHYFFLLLFFIFFFRLLFFFFFLDDEEGGGGEKVLFDSFLQGK